MKADMPATSVDEKRFGLIQIEIGIAIEIETPWDRETNHGMRTASPQPMRKFTRPADALISISIPIAISIPIPSTPRRMQPMPTTPVDE